MATETKNSVVKLKSNDPNDPLVVKKKLANSSNLPSDSKMKSVTKSEVKLAKKTTSKVREKKVYSLPGQKHDPPEERDPLRIFYESLSKQIPTSEMAEFWLMEHGMLSPERAKKAFEKKQRKRTGAPLKTSTITETSNKQKGSKNGDNKDKKIIVESDEDADLVVSPKRKKG
ncbi:non-specific serine/threonine protein kinase [Trifolium repens]|nr:non-specific serine/threonine protein kinase [Trifolium repens]